MKNSEQNQNERQYYIDWLRILLILSVFLFHIGMIFNTWNWHVKNDVKIVELKYIMEFLHVWRIPLLFLVSGAGTYFALGMRTRGQYLKERAKRLLLPAIVGIFLLVPIQVYLDTNFTERMSKYANLFEFYPHMFEGIYPNGNFSWHHLYFIIYLFTIALIITPFLKFLRSERFARFMKWLEKIVCKPFGLNVFLIPLILSQVILRPFFPDETHDLVNDWASMAIYLVFFIAGYMLLSNKNIVVSIGKYRYLYLIQTVFTTAFMFTVPYMVNSEATGEMLWVLGSLLVGWSTSMTAIGFAQRFLNRDSKFKKLANEAIYPFYLLHQPAIVIAGYYIVQWDMSVLMKFVLITIISLSLTVSVYWLFIRPFNFTRVIFGMKMIKRKKEVEISDKQLEPIHISVEKAS